MSVEAELIAAIAAAPDDDTPRMVYADHLMQRGDPRGEFIALQCRLARADAADELPDDAVVARERELRETHAAAWTTELRAVGQAGHTFRRDFVEHVAFWSDRACAELLAQVRVNAPLVRSIQVPATVIQAPITAAWDGLEAVMLHESSDASLDSVQAFVASPHLASLRRLQISSASLANDEARLWLSIPRPLDHLGLHLGAHAIARPTGVVVTFAIRDNRALHHLRSLHLGGFELEDIAPLGALSRLEALALHRTKTRDLPAVLATLQLATFELDGEDRWDPSRGQVCEPLDAGALVRALPNLRRFALRSWVLGSDGVRELLAQLPASIRRLELDSCRLGPDGAEVLLTSDRVRELVWLHVDDSTVPQDLRPALAALCRHRYVPPTPVYPDDVVEYLPKNKIGAIKMYRQHTRAGLADSKLAVERICEELGFGAYWGNRASPRWCRP